MTVLFIHFAGFLLIDPLLSMGFGLVLLWASWGVLRDAGHLLMEGAPAEINFANLQLDAPYLDESGADATDIIRDADKGPA